MNRPPAFQELERALDSEEWDRLEQLAARPRALLGTSDDGLPILALAAGRGAIEAVAALLRAGADPDGREVQAPLTPLLSALLNGHPQVVETLLEAGADPEASSGLGRPIFAAISEGDVRSFEALVAAGVDLERPHFNGWSVRDAAADPFVPAAIRARVEELTAAPEPDPEPVEREAGTPSELVLRDLPARGELQPGPWSGRTGVGEGFFEMVKVAHFAVEDSVTRVSTAIEETRGFFRLPATAEWRMERDVLGRPRPREAPLVGVFQLGGQAWTQVVVDLRSVRSEILLARHLSTRLDTRCLCLGITDDAYDSRALYEGGVLRQLAIWAMDADIEQILASLDHPIPPRSAAVDVGDVSSSQRSDVGFRDDGQPIGDLGELLDELGCYLHPPSLLGDRLFAVHGVDAADVVRLDVVW